MEVKIISRGLIVRARLDSVESDVITATDDKYRAVVKFNLAVIEHLKGTSPTSIVAFRVYGRPYDTRSEAESRGVGLLAERDTQWDDREAIIFLNKPLPGGDLPATFLQPENHYLLIWGSRYWPDRDDEYSLYSNRTRSWLPAASDATRQTGDSQKFLVALPGGSTGGGGGAGVSDSNTITLGELKTLITSLMAEYNGGDGSEAYTDCVYDKYQHLRNMRNFPIVHGEPFTVWNLETTAESGQTAGTILDQREAFGQYKDGTAPDDARITHTITGKNASLFEITRTTAMALDEDNDGTNDRIQYEEIVRTARPLPPGEYEFVLNESWAAYAICNFVISNEWTVTVTAPTGTLHEAFFDPVTVGSAIAADATNGVLKPTSFTDGNSAAATLQSIAWESPSTGSGQAGTVKMKLSPHTGLANHVVDFIALDGKVSLSLDTDEATVDAANNTLSWPVTYQPWNDGDKLMLRIHNGPVTPVPTPTPGPTPAAPTGLTATAGAGSVTLTWNNPSDSTITGYEYQMRWAGVAWQPWKTISGSGSSTTSHTVTGLTGGTEYRFHLRAVNANGSGTAAPNADPWYVAATPSVPPPAAPTGLTATAGRESVKLSWNNPSDSTITRYEYQARWTGVGWQSWKAIPNSDSSTTSHLVTGLTGGTEYRFKIRAMNASGAGPQAPNAPPWYVSATPGKR